MDRLRQLCPAWCVRHPDHEGLCMPTMFPKSNPRKATAMTTLRYRITFKSGQTSGVAYYDAPSLDDALARAALEHDPFVLVDARVEGTSPPLTVEQQRDGLIRALRPIYTVCRALLDNPHAAPLFTEQMRKGLEGMCADAVAALKAAGVER